MLELSSATISTLFLELVKFIYRKIIKNPGYNFPSAFYIVALPVLNMAFIPLLAFLGIGNYLMPTDWTLFAKDILAVLLSSLASIFVYTTAVSPLKTYARDLRTK